MINIPMDKCGFTKNGNIKLGTAMWVFLKLYGDMEHDVKRLGCSVKGTCGGCCEGCKHACYVKASYRYGSVIYGHAVRTIAMRENRNALFVHLDEQIKRAKNKPAQVRIDQSGELETADEYLKWIELARKHPNTDFYVYTKRYDIVTEILDSLGNDNIPTNFITLISIWHEYGIKEFLYLAKYDCIKAFVYMDGFNYEAYGIHVQTMCKAYDENGKLDHNITCDKCGKCFRKSVNSKVVGCSAH